MGIQRSLDLARAKGQSQPRSRHVNTGVHVVDGVANAPRLPPPDLAEHGADVLRSVLGKSDDEIARLQAAGII